MSAEEVRRLEEVGAISKKPVPWCDRPPARPFAPAEAFKLGRVMEYDHGFKDRLAALYVEIG